MTDSSDNDSFHSASDGEQNEIESTASLSTGTSSPKNANFTDSKESNDGFEKIEKPSAKDEDALFKVPEIPASRMRKDSVPNRTASSIAAKSDSGAATKKSNSVASEEEDDWFRAQIDEFHKDENPSRPTAQQAARRSSDSEDEKTKKSKTIWDWTGIHEVVSAVGEGFSSAVEAGLGLPHAEEMAKLSVAERRRLVEEAQHMKEPEPSLSSDEGLAPDPHSLFRPKKSSGARHCPPHSSQGSDRASAAADPFDQRTAAAAAGSSSTGGGFFSGGGIFSNFVSAPLDVLESLGKKTFETLTVKDEGESDKRRFFLRSGESSEGQSLSQILRELRDNEGKAERAGSEKSRGGGQRHLMGCDEKFNTNFVSLFEKHEGMVHLEGLELISRDQDRRTKSLPESREFNETLLDFCVEDVSECSTKDFEKEFAKSVHFISLPFKPDDVLETNRSLTQELTLRQAAVDATEEIVVDAIHEAAITALAKLTAHSISSLHKIAQLIVIAKKLPEVESLFAFTYLLCRRLSFFATQYTNILNLVESSNRVDEVVTNIFFECSNACHDVKKALELLRPFFKKTKSID